MKDKLSICIPTYRRPNLLNEAVFCALRAGENSGVDFEIVVMNNEPEQKFWCKDSRVNVFNMKTHLENIGCTYNKLWSLSTGNLIAMRDDDDLIHSQSFVAAFSRMQHFGPNGIYKAYLAEKFAIDKDPPVCVYGPAHWTCIVSDALMKRINAYSPLQYGVGSDVLFVKRLKHVLKLDDVKIPQDAPPMTLYRKFSIKAFHEGARRVSVAEFSEKREAETRNFKKGKIEIVPKCSIDVDTLLDSVDYSNPGPAQEIDENWK